MKKFRFLLVMSLLALVISCGDTSPKVEERTVELSSSSLTEKGYFDGLLYYKIISNNPPEAEVLCDTREFNKDAVFVPTWLKIGFKKYKVTRIGERAFEGCTGLTSVDIPNSVTSIGWGAFSGCTGLTSIDIPNSVTSIDENAFEDCTDLISINISNNVTSIGGWTFRRCSSLISIEIPNGVTSIGWSSFEGCTNLTSIKTPNSVKSIYNYAFGYCTGLTSVEIPNSVTYIDHNAFKYCSGLTSVHIKCNNPPMTGIDCFLPEIQTLYVPVGTKSKYARLSPWNTFQNIVEE